MPQTEAQTARPSAELEQRAVNAIRALTIDATQRAGSGHPGMPMGMAAVGYALFHKLLTFNPKNPRWWNRDRYVQSAGHGSMLIYSLLHLTGYDLPMEQLKHHRQWGSKTPGHPEHGLTPGVEMTTGPLGQGISSAVGMALAEAHLAARYNRPDFDLVDHYTYVIASDGDVMEGVSHEAGSFAGHLGLGKLIVLYDDNQVTLDAASSVSFDEDVLERYDAYHWHTQRVADGNDVGAIAAAIQKAKDERERPSIIAVRTVIGYGAPDKQGTHEAHGSALGAEEAAAAKRELGIDWPEFTVPEDVLALYREAVPKGEAAERAWDDLYRRYQEQFPEEAAEFARVMKGEVPGGLEPKLPHFAVGDKGQATRNASNKAINALAPLVPQLMGGSADLSGSTKTTIEGEPFIERGDYGGRNIYFGVREHGMAAAANGMALHGGVRPFVGTFLIFSDYLRPSLRLGALMELPVIYVFSHDSIGLGGDGPTHQPISQLMALRAIPNVTLIRPADANETQQAWIWAVAHKSGPVALALTRQSVPNLEVPEGAVEKGAYVLSDCEGEPQVVLIGTGSEVQLCLGAQELLKKEGIRARVVSLPSFEIFDAQDESYRASVLPPNVKARVAVEAGATLGWQKYVGLEGTTVTLDHFGASAEGEVVMEKFGFTAENVAEKARALVQG